MSAICEVLNISRGTYYYEPVEKQLDNELIEAIKKVTKESTNNYGTRKIKKELEKIGLSISRRRIGRIMQEHGLFLNYTVAQFNPFKSKVNENPVKNELARQFNDQKELTVVVSDLTYVRVSGEWSYVCLFVDLYIIVTLMQFRCSTPTGTASLKTSLLTKL